MYVLWYVLTQALSVFFHVTNFTLLAGSHRIRGFSGIGSEYQYISFVLPFQLHEIRDAKKFTTLRPSVN